MKTKKHPVVVQTAEDLQTLIEEIRAGALRLPPRITNMPGLPGWHLTFNGDRTYRLCSAIELDYSPLADACPPWWSPYERERIEEFLNEAKKQIEPCCGPRGKKGPLF
jgi:hypothetical protein